MFGYRVLGFGAGGGGQTTMLSAESRWLDIDRSSWTFSGADITLPAANAGLRTLFTWGKGATDSRDNYPLTYEFTVPASADNFVVGFYDLEEEDTFDNSSATGGAGSMTKSWWVTLSTGQCNYGGSTVGSAIGDLSGKTCKFTINASGHVEFTDGTTTVSWNTSTQNADEIAIRPFVTAAGASQTLSDVSIRFRNRVQADFGTFRLAVSANNGGIREIGGGSGAGGFRFNALKRMFLLRVVWSHTSTTASESYNSYLYADDGAGPPSSPADNGTPDYLEESSNTQSHSSTGSKTWEFGGTTELSAGTDYWSVLPDFATGVNYSIADDASSFAGDYGSGRNNTSIFSITSNGIAEEWRVRIIGWVEPGDV